MLGLGFTRYTTVPGKSGVKVVFQKTINGFHSIYLIPEGRGGDLFPLPPPSQYHNSKSIDLRLLKLSDFSLIPIALPLGLNPGFYANCPSPQADYLFLYCNKLNLLFDSLSVVSF